jgi:hypothetical protein
VRSAVRADPRLLEHLCTVFLTGGPVPAGYDRSLQRDARLERLLRLLGDARGTSAVTRLSACVLVRQPPRRTVAREVVQSPLAPAMQPSRPPREDHWLEVRVVDPKGNPLSNVQCEIALSNSELRYASSDADGFVYLKPIPSGTCGIRLPTIDFRAWSPQGGARAILVRKGSRARTWWSSSAKIWVRSPSTSASATGR